MPATYTHVYSYHERGGNRQDLYDCALVCDQCAALAKNGLRCRRRVCFGLPYCFTHMRTLLHVKVDKAKYGKGLFATQDIPKNTIIFKYKGELVDSNEINRRYPDRHTGPYVVGNSTDPSKSVDSICERFVPSYMNHSTNANVAFHEYPDDEFFSNQVMRKVNGNPLTTIDGEVLNDGDILCVVLKKIKAGKELLASYSIPVNTEENPNDYNRPFNRVYTFGTKVEYKRRKTPRA